MTQHETTREWEELFKENGDQVDVNQLSRMLDKFTVDFPPEHVIQNTIDQAVFHVLQPREVTAVPLFKRIWGIVSFQTEYVAKWFWLVSALMFLSGYLITASCGYNPYKIIIILSPLPFILGILELFRSVDSGMSQIELTCKTSLPQTLMARLTVLGIYNIVLNTAMSVGLSWLVGMDLWRVVLFWFVPFTWISAVTLYLSTKFRGRALVPVVALVWSISVALAFSNPSVLSFLLSLNDVMFVVLSLLGLVLFASQIKLLYVRFKGGLLVEITD
ncbi:hypothetical protein [Alicyclobacillus tolerans]|uniref:ABC-2 family transporter protein n=1 Tax=Alicyclobacillus tolerans TaxID=90970 RepID=A0A1M6UKM3_9BACL|nr:hypothetical protein [Alicyclobacillus montanus]SHK69741.1 hypothetical protein SAMN05443507_12017 [Alicyclobacillus montanus]